ncbi:DNA-directed RNA polymerase [Candidatus Nanohalobium constans]|uniref:DNA-directed RNA polymerase subunit Rpo7 n=1 Tax=Candidatus Nanohalobium constans TaxID=2565781 RepID=A0A5Q0UGE4_9ARCH|nr:DNA-directed RNA polymerase [Candidatus Nanohalobium constans]QGA80664.1 DNA-directed RNA polymerase subunit E' [Candidatus Nanohalobium constans]
MYKRLTIQDSVRVPPQHLGENVSDSVRDGLREEVEGDIVEDVGVVIGVEDVNSVEGGDIEPEDAGVHYQVEYEAIVYDPELHEVVTGEVVDITDFGAFIRIGPFDGLCHVSQVMDEYVNLDEDAQMLISEDQDRALEVGDTLTTRIIAVSLGKKDTNKINLTMRQPGLGKEEWIEMYEEEKAEQEQEDEEEEE